jgi:undecaprenyl-diphosphatase
MGIKWIENPQLVYSCSSRCAIVLSVSAHFFAPLPFDPVIAQALQKEQGTVFLAMQLVSELGETWIEAILVGTVITIFLVRRLFPEAVFVLASASSVGLNSVLKVLISRPRPPAFFQNPTDFFLSVDQYSFPSGHVRFYVVFFGFVAFFAWSFLYGRARWFAVVICTSLIVLIGPPVYIWAPNGQPM